MNRLRVHPLAVFLLVYPLGCLGKGPLPEARADVPDPSQSHEAPVTPSPPLDVGETFDAAHNNGEEQVRKAEEERVNRWQRWRKKYRQPRKDAWKKAEKFQRGKNWKDALDLYVALLVHTPLDARAVEAAEAVLHNAAALGQYGEGIMVAEDALLELASNDDRARLHRILGNYYLSIPHTGTTSGGKLLRDQWTQGIRTQTYREDRAKAIAHLEEARLLMAGSTTFPMEERVKTLTDLVSAVAHFTPFDPTWHFWWYAWGSGAWDGLEEDEGEDEHADNYRRQRGRHGAYHQLHHAQPRGMPVTPQGEVIFSPKPSRYSPELDDTAKIKFLLDEAVKLDTSPSKEMAARALLIQAHLFRTRDGPEKLERLSQWNWEGGYPYSDDIQRRALHTLKDHEVLGLIATHIGVYKVPHDENVPVLLTTVMQRYPDTEAADEAHLALGSFYQSRQQYDLATNTYLDYLRLHPKGPRAEIARSALHEMNRPEMVFIEQGVQPAGRNAILKVKSRNMDEVVIEAQKMDLERVMRDFKNGWKQGVRDDGSSEVPLGVDGLLQAFNWNHPKNLWKRYRKGASVVFSPRITKNPGGHYATTTITSPLTESGLYALIAKDKETGKEISRGLVLLENMVVVSKNAKDSSLVWVVDSVSGQAIQGAEVEILTYWRDDMDDRPVRNSSLEHAVTDERGMIRQPPMRHPSTLTVRYKGMTSYAGQHHFYRSYAPPVMFTHHLAVITTDRPVYRPGSTVQGKVWIRRKREGQYQPASHVTGLNLRIHDARQTRIHDQELPTDEWGSASFSLELKNNAALGMYRMEVRVGERTVETGGAQFRVEEYKAPEFTVTVTAAGQARLGDKIPAEINAAYLFGGGVADAKVRYKVFRQDHQVTYAAPNRWDWLYGGGYGRCVYNYRWFPGWSSIRPHPRIWYPWWGPPPESVKELVNEGEGKLDARGVLKIAIDTAPAKAALGNTDHRYTVVAEVTDQSRRLIKGEGSVVVTRHSYLAFMESAQGYYNDGESVTMVISTQLPDGRGYPVKGRMLVEEVIYQGENGDTFTESMREEIPVQTDALGATPLTWRSGKTGQFKFSFVAPDEWGGEVRASTVVWVAGPGFNGRHYRFNGLEVITDKRTYKPGDTAKLLVNVNQAGANVLLATKAEDGALLEWEVISMPEKSRVIEIPITEAHVPNFFVDATTVAQGSLFQEAREVFVPPQDSVLNVSIKTDKREYRPGDKGEVTVTTTDKDGKPVAADLAVSVFDSAVLSIQPELTPDLRVFFWDRKRTHQVNGLSNLSRRLAFGYPFLNPPHLQATTTLQSLGQKYFQQVQDFRLDTRSRKLADRAVVALADSNLDGAMAGAGRPIAIGGLSKTRNDPRDMEDIKYKREASVETSAPVAVRQAFADTAAWFPNVRTGADGVGKVTVTFPDNLTTWKIKVAGLTPDTRAGQASELVRSTKQLLIRLEAPRFFRERDRVTLSAIVHNTYPVAKKVTVTLEVPATHLVPTGLIQSVVDVPANGEKRVDFEVDVKARGNATVRMTARSDVESDAKELTFPVLVHGMTRTISNVGSISAKERGTVEKSITVDVPDARRPELTRLSIRYSPTLAGAILDALPYLLDYPYGCTEQTLSRFIPAVLTQKVLTESSGLDLTAFQQTHTNLNPQQLTPGGQQDRQRLEQAYRHDGRHPVFNQETLTNMIDAGMRRIARMQHADGGWGWWADDASSIYTTAYVVMSLKDAQEAGLTVDGTMISRGVRAMKAMIPEHLQGYEDSNYVSDTDAFLAWVLSRFNDKDGRLDKLLWARRALLGNQGKLLFTLALHARGEKSKAAQLMRNAEHFLKEDPENETAWLETDRNQWWHWWQDDIETNAMYLRALDALRPGDNRANQVVKWLLNNRKNGWYWSSTRDTAMTVVAFANHMKVTGEGAPNYQLDVLWDGKPLKTVSITRENLFTYDAEAVLQGADVTTGKHTITFRRNGNGSVYFNSYLSCFTLEEDIQKTGLEIKVDRTYYKLERNDRKEKMFGERGQPVEIQQVAYRKVPLQSGARLQSGDLVLVELMLTSKNDYTFLAFEDPKPAGTEPVALRSGTTFGEAVSNMELRDDKVVFFLSTLHRGQIMLRYRLRAEIPGEFHAMPTLGFGMYAPELQTNSDEWRVKILD